MEFWITQIFNSISWAAIIFLLASGLSIIYGIMDIVNVAHCSFYLLAGYVGLSVQLWTGNFFFAILSGVFIVVVMALIMERFFLRPLEGKLLGQVLITIGIAFFFQDFCLVFWGGDPHWLEAPSYLTKNISIQTLTFSGFRVFVIALAVCVALGLWWLQEKTKFGIMLRASTDDREMAEGCGVKFSIVSMGAFALGGGLGALSGVVGSAVLGIYPGIDFEILPYPFAAVIIGGFGSLRGVILASIMLALIDNFGKALFPQLSYFTMFAPMTLILAIRPRGLFGKGD